MTVITNHQNTKAVFTLSLSVSIYVMNHLITFNEILKKKCLDDSFTTDKRLETS